MPKKILPIALLFIAFSSMTFACLTPTQSSLVTQLAINNNISATDLVNLFDTICNMSQTAKNKALSIENRVSDNTNKINNTIQDLSQVNSTLNKTKHNLLIKIKRVKNWTNKTYTLKDTFIESNNVLMHKIDLVNNSLNSQLAQWLDSQIEKALKKYPSNKNFSALQDQIDTRFENYNKNLNDKVNLMETQVTRNVSEELVTMIPKQNKSATWVSIIALFVSVAAAGYMVYKHKLNEGYAHENMQSIKTGARTTYKTIYDNTKDWEDHLVQLRTQILRDKELDKKAKVELMKQIDRAVIQNEEDVQKYAEQYKLMKREGIDLSEIKSIKSAVNGKRK